MKSDRKPEFAVEHENGVFRVYSYTQTSFGAKPAKNFIGERENAEDAENLMRRAKNLSGLR